MRFKPFITPLFLLPFCVFGQPINSAAEVFFSSNPVEKNTLVKTYTNENEPFKRLNSGLRSMDYPTQIIRTTGSVEGQNLSCEQVNETIQRKIVRPITADRFFYNTYISCVYDNETHLATRFLINSFFDPLTDEAIDFADTFIAENNGSDLFGTKLNIEPAKGLVIAMSIAAGVKKNSKTPLFIQYRQDRSNFHFKSNYDMKNKLFTDVYENFFSNDPEKILPFLDRWIFDFAGKIYSYVLIDSNYVELQPERIFLMNSGEPIFVSNLRFYFGHVCTKNGDQHCLKLGS